MTTISTSLRPGRPSALGLRIGLLVTLTLFIGSIVILDFEPERLLELPAGVAQVFWRMFLETGPEWGYLGPALGLMVESIQIAWIGTIIGAIISLPFGFFGAKNITSGLTSSIVRQVLNGIRAIPEILVAVIIFIPMVGLGAYAGALAIGIHSIGTLGKLSAEVIEGIDPGPVEAARAAGGRSLQVQRWGVLPQVLPEIVAFWLYRFEINVRASAVLGVLGAGGIGEALVQSLRFARYDRAGMCVIVVIVITIAIDYVSGSVRRRIIQGSGGRPRHGEELEQPEFAEVARPA
ncbi:MAG: phosphonate ABC transporter, permease protein PhnE [Chloroflexota bacterium]